MNDEPVMQLGDVFEIKGASWLVVGWTPVTWTLARIPDGETSNGLGRTWDADVQEEMILPRALVDRATRIQ